MYIYIYNTGGNKEKKQGRRYFFNGQRMTKGLLLEIGIPLHQLTAAKCFWFM